MQFHELSEFHSYSNEFLFQMDYSALELNTCNRFEYMFILFDLNYGQGIASHIIALHLGAISDSFRTFYLRVIAFSATFACMWQQAMFNRSISKSTNTRLSYTHMHTATEINHSLSTWQYNFWFEKRVLQYLICEEKWTRKTEWEEKLKWM